MKLAVISDIHSNYLALEAAMHAVHRESADGIVFLGDYVSDCPYPQRTMEQLYEAERQYRCWFIRGNREDYLLSHRKNPNDGWETSSSSGSLLYTYENLTDRDLDFFASMPICEEIALPGCPPLTACHASPVKTKEWICSNPVLLERYAKMIGGKLLLCGHTHRTEVRHAGGKRILFCPSVGLPQDGCSHARITFLTCSGGKWISRMQPLSFDKEALIRSFSESGLINRAEIWAACIIRSIREERDYAAQCVTLAWRYAAADRFSGSILPEAYWQAAAKKLGILG